MPDEDAPDPAGPASHGGREAAAPGSGNAAAATPFGGPAATAPHGAGRLLLVLLRLIFGALFLVAGLAIVLLTLFGMQTPDGVERYTMYGFASLFALPVALVTFGLSFWIRRILRRCEP